MINLLKINLKEILIKKVINNMADALKIQILSNGSMKIQRGNKGHNDNLRKFISYVSEGNSEIMNRLEEFLEGSEDVELLLGDRFCG